MPRRQPVCEKEERKKTRLIGRDSSRQRQKVKAAWGLRRRVPVGPREAHERSQEFAGRRTRLADFSV